MESDRKTEKAELKVLGANRKRSRDFPGSLPAVEWNPPAMQETSVPFLGREDLLEKGYATHSNILGFPVWLNW